MEIIYIILIILGVLLVYFWITYNKFVTTKTLIKASIQEIGNQLKRQSDLIPNLIESVRGYMKHEKDIFDKIAAARKMVAEAVKSGNAQKLVEASTAVNKALTPIKAIFESTPQLQAAIPTAKLMEELRDTADKIMYSRRVLIDLTADYNIMVVNFPSNLIASLFGFKEEKGFIIPPETEEEIVSLKNEETKTPKVSLDA